MAIALCLILIWTIRRRFLTLAMSAQAIASLNTLLARMERDALRQQQLSDDMVHDLRTCLSVLQLQADLHDHIATEKLQPHYREMAQLISGYLARAHEDQMAGLTGDFSDLSRDAMHAAMRMASSSIK